MKYLYFVILSCIGIGCADNAVTEFRPRLPVADSGRSFAVIDFLPQSSADNAQALFNSDWGEQQLPGFALGTSQSEPDMSVVATPDNIGDNLLVRVRFCGTDTCADETSPSEIRVVVEEPFYEGKTTYIDIDLSFPADGAPEERVFGVCEVKGCRCGDDMPCPRAYTKADDCRRLDGFEGRPHYCITE